MKVLDFGLAKAMEPAPRIVAEHVAVTDDHLACDDDRRRACMLGTAAYMSPEQARGKAVDKRSDIWAFGCVLYEMLTGRSPFARSTLTDTLAAIVDREPDWKALPLSVSPAIRRVLLRCIEKDPKRRLHDIADARIEIEDALRGETVLSTSAVAAPPAPPRRVPWLVAGFTTLAALTAGLWVYTNESSALANPLANAQFTRFTDFEGSENDAAISRDGRFVAFRSDRDGPVDTWVSQVGSGRFVNLTNGARPSGLVRNAGFVPDGSEIWFAAVVGGDRMRLTPSMGGTPRPFLSERTMNLAWSQDGSQLVFHTNEAGDPMFVADSKGANPRQIFTLKAGGHNHYPIWSPDAQWIYFVSGVWDTREMDIWRIRPSGGTPERLTNQNSDMRYLTLLDERTIRVRIARPEWRGTLAVGPRSGTQGEPADQLRARSLLVRGRQRRRTPSGGRGFQSDSELVECSHSRSAREKKQT